MQIVGGDVSSLNRRRTLTRDVWLARHRDSRTTKGRGTDRRWFEVFRGGGNSYLTRLITHSWRLSSKKRTSTDDTWIRSWLYFERVL